MTLIKYSIWHQLFIQFYWQATALVTQILYSLPEQAQLTVGNARFPHKLLSLPCCGMERPLLCAWGVFNVEFYQGCKQVASYCQPWPRSYKELHVSRPLCLLRASLKSMGIWKSAGAHRHMELLPGVGLMMVGFVMQTPVPLGTGLRPPSQWNSIGHV